MDRPGGTVPVIFSVVGAGPAIQRRSVMLHMGEPRVTTWSEAPALAIPDPPALLSDSSNLWLAYETTEEPRGEVYAIVRFRHVIDHRLSPINDEGLGQHPYAGAGL